MSNGDFYIYLHISINIHSWNFALPWHWSSIGISASLWYRVQMVKLIIIRPMQDVVKLRVACRQSCPCTVWRWKNIPSKWTKNIFIYCLLHFSRFIFQSFHSSVQNKTCSFIMKFVVIIFLTLISTSLALFYCKTRRCRNK